MVSPVGFPTAPSALVLRETGDCGMNYAKVVQFRLRTT
jgi:hypothetical protein